MKIFMKNVRFLHVVYRKGNMKIETYGPQCLTKMKTKGAHCPRVEEWRLQEVDRLLEA